MANYVVVEMTELEQKKRDRWLSIHETELIIEHKDIFIKFLNEGTHYLQMRLALWEVKGLEASTYNMIDTYAKIKDDLNSLIGTLKKAKEDITKSKEAKK